MTRKTALSKAISALEGKEEYTEVVELLSDIREEIPFTKWSDKAIHDTIQQFIMDNGRVPTATDFRKKKMPPHPIFKNRYKITLGEWLKINYPTENSFRDNFRKSHVDKFIDEYNNIKPTSSAEYNSKRRPGAPLWRRIANYIGASTWDDLLEMLQLKVYLPPPAKEFCVTVFNDYTFED